MTSSSSGRRRGSDRGDYGFARVRDQAFDAVIGLWRIRKAEGMKQKDVAEALNAGEAWVSRQLSGPGNWTLRTIGELVEALDGELEIHAFPREEPSPERTNYDAYDGYRPEPNKPLELPAVSFSFSETYVDQWKKSRSNRTTASDATNDLVLFEDA